MRATIASKIALMQLFKNASFSKDMGKACQSLANMGEAYRANSKDANLSPRKRARARDMEQNISGILHGIGFAVASIDKDHQEIDRVNDLLSRVLICTGDELDLVLQDIKNYKDSTQNKLVATNLSDASV